MVKEIIISWFEYSHHEPCNKISIHNQIIWFNSHVRIDNRTIFIKTLYDQDILYIQTHIDTNGEHLTLVQFQEKHNVHINMLDYYGITRQSEMADLARRATRDLSQFHMGGPVDLGNYNA